MIFARHLLLAILSLLGTCQILRADTLSVKDAASNSQGADKFLNVSGACKIQTRTENADFTGCGGEKTELHLGVRDREEIYKMARL